MNKTINELINEALDKKKENLLDTVMKIEAAMYHRLSIGYNTVCWYNNQNWSHNWHSDVYCLYNTHVNGSIFTKVELEFIKDILIMRGFEVCKKSRFFGLQTWYEVSFPS